MNFDYLYPFVESKFYNNELREGFWSVDKFNPRIRKKLLRIVKDFACPDGDCPDIDDIQLTGSLANYNYTKYSDLDVHILIDFSKINKDIDLVKAALDGKRFIWNLRHEVKMHGHEVELYYQDTNEPHIASGLFSLLHNKWIKTPKYDPPEIDSRDVEMKARSISNIITKLKRITSKSLSSKRAAVLHKYAKRLKDKIKNMRQSGLNREGEFSVENLAFKELRNNGSIGDLIDIVSDTYAKIYSEQALVPVREDLMSFNDVLGVNARSSKNKPTDDDLVNNFLGIMKDKRGPRQQKWGTGAQRQSQNILPDMHRHDATLNDKIENLRKMPSGKSVVSLVDLKYIIPKYNIKNLSHNTKKDSSKRLGTTGIQLYYDDLTNSYCIEKERNG